MTDLDRAQSILRSFEPAVHPAMREVFVKCMAHSLAAARREGAELRKAEAMNDNDLAHELNIPLELVSKIEPKKRSAYERMIEFARRWNAGLPIEIPAIVCREHRR